MFNRLTLIREGLKAEGMVFGKAVVAARIGGVLDFIRDGENGLMASADDPTDFANKIISILEDRDLMERLCKRVTETGVKLFSGERVYRQLLNLYQSLREV